MKFLKKISLKNSESKTTSEKIIYQVSLITILGNLLLTIIKLFAGFFGKSIAMISDAVHSASDVLSTFAVIIGAKFSNKKADKEHPYGHEKIESVTSIILAVMLFISGISIGFCGINEILKSQFEPIAPPSSIVIWFAILSIIVKEIMYKYTKKAANKINSSSLRADAWHHRSDALSSVGSLIGVTGAVLGFPILDPIASIAICLIIIKVSYNIAKTGFNQIIDTAASPEVENQIRSIIKNQSDILKIDSLKTRQFGNKIYVDIEVQIDKNKSFQDVHSLIHQLRLNIEQHNPSIKHCMIHANPSRNN